MGLAGAAREVMVTLSDAIYTRFSATTPASSDMAGSPP
jgi:hypothetical protein